jgi:hypothetical protein
MQTYTYEELHERFPTKKLARKLFQPGAKPNAVSVVLMQVSVQRAILTAVEENPYQRQLLTRNGKCLLHRFVDEDEKTHEFIFANETDRRYATRRLANELRRFARDGVDVQGFGTIVVEDGEVVFVPRPIVPKYGNILFFVPGMTY